VRTLVAGNALRCLIGQLPAGHWQHRHAKILAEMKHNPGKPGQIGMGANAVTTYLLRSLATDVLTPPAKNPIEG
jgi:hypothetical protein